MIFHGQREILQAGCAGFHLLRRHGQVLRKRHPVWERTGTGCDLIGGTPIETRTDDEVYRESRTVRSLAFTGKLAGITHFGNIVAVGVVVWIVEEILHEAAFRVAFCRLDDLRQYELSRNGVPDGRYERPQFEFVRKRAVEQDDVACKIQDVEVHRTVSPRAVRVPEDHPGP